MKVLANAELRSNADEIGDGRSDIIVCAVVPTPLMRTRELDVIRDYDVDGDAFLGEVERIVSISGCWNPLRIRPLDPADGQLAGVFRSKLGILATQMLGRLLVEAHP